MEHQPVPKVSRDDVLRIIARDYPPEHHADILRDLDLLENPEIPRVQLAVLKLVNGRLAELQNHIGMAHTDYRDVLMWAEYPADAKVGWSEAPGAHQDAYRADREQYQTWLRREK
jgi:hypothetical protein